MLDIDGKLIREVKAETQTGLHKVVWNLTHTPERRRGGGAPPAGRSRQSQQAGRPVAPGVYRIVLSVDGVEHKQTLRVEGDPGAANPSIAEED